VLSNVFDSTPTRTRITQRKFDGVQLVVTTDWAE
jgi:hypothetical protein